MTKFSGMFVVITVIILLVHKSGAFNLSPKPNIVFREPKWTGIGIPKVRSSYFGFSLNLKQNSVLVGAPRAQSTLEVQRKINETGAVYKCSFDNSGGCKPFVIDEWGNVQGESNQYTYNSEKKDYQWLGATMDGNANDNDKFVVCAPRLTADITSHYLMHGICYWGTNTSSSILVNNQKIAPLRLKDKQQYASGKDWYFYHMYGELGISVHITENNEEILIGAPGIFTWKGSVIRHKAKPLVDLGGLSRRDQAANSFRRQRILNVAHEVEYSSDVPNPMLWNQDDNSYFGFAVSSGYFDGIGKNKLLYVASAPQANLQQGAVYIFDIVDHDTSSDKTIKIYHTFPGQQFGEYFGYSLLTEDFDGDGLTDIAIGAPYNSKTGSYENGAVYIFKNEGTSSNFALHAILRSDYEFDGRFGTIMSKVGDINQDGFNDLIVASPFEENGAIYIFHGSSKGLPERPSQRIAAPHSGFVANQMFGHGMSKGADVDGNQYLDIAVGSPNAETVYIYKSYPVIRINATINPLNYEIKVTARSFKFNVCWLFESSYPIGFDVHFNATVKLDGQLGRAVFQDKRNEYEINGKISPEEQCIQLEASVTFSSADIFRPIELEMTHHVLNGIPTDNSASETQDFCDTCVAVSPSDAKNVKSKIVFSTGCKSERCVADLKIKSSLENVPSLPYILGSSSSLSILYNIENSGETAYLAQIRITLPGTGVLFTKTPSNCLLNENAPNSNIMVCDLNSGTPMFKGDDTSIRFGIDTTKLDGTKLIVKAEVFSTGDELNDLDNIAEDIIPLKEFNNIEVLGDSIKSRITMGEAAEKENLTHIFEIRNNGPSNIRSLDVLVSLPVSHVNPWTLQRETLIDISSISIKSMYNGQSYNVEWTQNNTILILDAIESTTSTANTPVEDYNGMQFDASKMGLDFDLSGGQPTNEEALNDSTGDRRRRSVENVHNTYFNPYLQRVMQSDEMGSSIAWNNMDLLGGRQKRDIFSTNERILSNLPHNRTIYFDCKNAEQELCLQAKFTVENIKANDLPILITLNFTVDLKKVEKIMTEKRDVFVIRTGVELMKTADEDTSSMDIVQNQPFTIISKYSITSTPLWVYVISIIFGILCLILISYALYRLGFFARGKRDELVKLKRQSEVMANYWVAPGDESDH